jgi:hypothetical protein
LSSVRVWAVHEGGSANAVLLDADWFEGVSIFPGDPGDGSIPCGVGAGRDWTVI